MTARTKSILLLLGALLIGVLIGGLIQASMVEQRIERIGYLRSERGFIRHVERLVEPHDEAQREAIRSVLRRNAQRMVDLRLDFRNEVSALLDSTRAELDSVLTDEQMERLEEEIRTREPDRRPRRGRMPGGRRRPGPADSADVP